MKIRNLLASFLLTVAIGLLHAQDAAPPSDQIRPQFLTVPFHVPEQAASAIEGHRVFHPGTALPSTESHTATAAPSSGGTQTALTNVDVSRAYDSYQGETVLFSKGNLLVGGYNSIFPGQCSASLANCAPGSAASTDGVNWTNRRMSLTVSGHAFNVGFDPSITADAAGTFYYAYGVADSSLAGIDANAIAVASSNNGINWTQKTPVTFNKSGNQVDDKYWIAADPNQTGVLYVGWTRNKGFDQTLMVAVSTDGGNRWSRPRQINDGTSSFERVLGAFPAVSPRDGTVYMAWFDYAKRKIFVDKSTDRGSTWGTDVAAATTHMDFLDIGCNGLRSMGPSPQLGIDGNGVLYLSYADMGGTTGMDVLLVKSSDGGATWSQPIKLNNDTGGAHQFNPALSVLPDTSGTVYVSWYDRRNDPNNCSTDVYTTTSIDGASTFSANARVTSASSNYDGNGNGPGDYAGNASLGSSNYPFWSSRTTADASKQTATAGAFEVYTGAVAH
jgi:hypothetical protein